MFSMDWNSNQHGDIMWTYALDAYVCGTFGMENTKT
jgi:hypothetical protein